VSSLKKNEKNLLKYHFTYVQFFASPIVVTEPYQGNNLHYDSKSYLCKADYTIPFELLQKKERHIKDGWTAVICVYGASSSSTASFHRLLCDGHHSTTWKNGRYVPFPFIRDHQRPRDSKKKDE